MITRMILGRLVAYWRWTTGGSRSRLLVGIGGPALVVGVIILAAAGGGGDESSNETSDEPARTSVDLSMDAVFDGDRLRISGQTDLPDGAELVYEVTHVEGIVIVASGTIPVAAGGYEAVENASPWPTGTFRVYLSFQPVEGVPALGDQAPEVIERYGDFGANLTGSNVVDIGSGKGIELEETLVR